MEELDFQKRLKNTGRNDSCPCGSGKKYKKCHLNEDEKMAHEEFKKRDEARKAAELEASELANEDSDNTKAKKRDNVNNSFQQYMSKGQKMKGTKSTSIPRRPAN
jgi:hypothetical protein